MLLIKHIRTTTLDTLRQNIIPASSVICICMHRQGLNCQFRINGHSATNYVESSLAQPHAHQNAEPARRAIFHGEGELLVVSQQKLPYSQTVPSMPSISPECTRGWQAMETIRAYTTIRNSDVQQQAAVYIGDHGHTPTNATLPRPSANSRPLKQDFICISPKFAIQGNQGENYLSLPLQEIQLAPRKL